jgi:hypothetical protein
MNEVHTLTLYFFSIRFNSIIVTLKSCSPKLSLLTEDVFAEGELKLLSGNLFYIKILPAGAGIFFFSPLRPERLRPTQPPIQWIPAVLSLEVKRPGRESDHSPPSSAEVRE